MDKEKLKLRYQKYSRNQLLNILDNTDDYTDEAISVAQSELERRGLWEKDLIEYEEEKANVAKENMAKAMNFELNFFHKVLFFLTLLVPFYGGAFRQNFAEDGHLLRIKQSFYYSRLGLISLVFVVSSSLYFELNEVVVFLLWLVFFIVALVFDKRCNRNRLLKDLENGNLTNEV